MHGFLIGTNYNVSTSAETDYMGLLPFKDVNS